MDPGLASTAKDAESPAGCVDEQNNGSAAGLTDLDAPTSASDASKAEKGKQEVKDYHEQSGKNSKHQRGWRRIIRNFTPSWFSVTMGTGVTSILLFNLPYNGTWLHYIAYIIFVLNVVLFVTFFLISLLRYTLYPKIWRAMIRHPAQSLFLGCFPMGLATIINMICFVCVPQWGGNWWLLAWALWWIDVALAVSTCCYLPFAIMGIHLPTLDSITATWLLPIVSTVVAAGSGSIVAGILPSAHNKLITLLTSYVLWGMGVPLAMVVLVIYFLRLTTKQLVAKEVIVSTFLPLGPLGMGGFAIQELGLVAKELFHETGTLPASMVYAGDILYVCGFLLALVMWGFGLVWFFFAVATIWRTPKFPFNMGWWGFTFPLGVYTISTTTLAKEIPSTFFKVLGTIFSVAVVLLWIVVSCGTLWKAWTGEIFFAPCLKDLETENGKKESKMLSNRANGESTKEH